MREQDRVGMEKYHFIDVLNQDRRGMVPRAEWTLVPLGFFFGTFFTFLTADFRPAGGVPGETWAAVAILFMALMILLTLVLAAWWLVHSLSHPRRDPGQLWEEIKDQIAKDNVQAQARRQLRDAATAKIERSKAETLSLDGVVTPEDIERAGRMNAIRRRLVEAKQEKSESPTRDDR